jgi:hypothetical protein
MLFTILCYDDEKLVTSWTKEEDAAVIAKLEVVQEKLRAAGKLGPVARLAPTKVAKTLKKGREAMIVDGPFAETKEQLLGFFVIDCASMDEAVEIARDLGKASSSEGSYEVRPMTVFVPNGPPG